MRVKREWHSNNFEGCLVRWNPEERKWQQGDIVWQPLGESRTPDTILAYTLEEQQDYMPNPFTLLMDDLWAIGIRPSSFAEEIKQKGELEATKYHLEDMRKVAGVHKK